MGYKSFPAVAGVSACNKQTLRKQYAIPFYPCRRGRLQGRNRTSLRAHFDKLNDRPAISSNEHQCKHLPVVAGVSACNKQTLNKTTCNAILSLQARTPARAKRVKMVKE